MVMKTQKVLKNIGLLLMVVMFTIPVGTSYAQNRCRAIDCNKISNLTVDQTKQLNDLRTKHLQIMEDLRVERRGTANVDEKSKVREQMKAELTRHQNAVEKMLTPEQWAQYQQNKNSNGRSFARKGKRGNGCGNGCQGRRGGGRNGRGNG